MSSTAPVDPTVPPPQEEGEGHLLRVLGTPSLVLFGLVYMVPLTVFTTYGLVTQMTGGRVPVAYLVTLAAMVFTARSYARMAAAYPVAGSAYTYSQKSFGAPIGFLAGWSLLLDYLFLPMLNYLVIGIYMEAALPAVPTWVWILVAIAIVTVLNIVGIVSVSWANVFIIGLQFLFIAVFIVMSIASISGSGNVNLMAPLAGDGTVDGFGPVFTGAALLCLSFLGFDAVSTLSEEAKDAKRTVPKAIMIATVLSGFIYFALSYVSQLVLPVQRVRGRRLGFARRDACGGWAVPERVLHRGVRCGMRWVGTDVAGVGVENPVRDGSRRNPAPQGVRVCIRALRHPGVRHPRGVGDLAGGAVDRSHGVDRARQFRCAGGILGGQPVGDQALLHRPEREAMWSTTWCCRSSASG